MLNDSRKFQFPWLAGKRLEGIGELYFTTEKKKKIENTCSIIFRIFHMQLGWSHLGMGGVDFSCFIRTTSYCLLLGLAAKNLIILITNINIFWNNVSWWHFRKVSLSVVTSLCPVCAQKWDFQNWTPARWRTPLASLALWECYFWRTWRKYRILSPAQALAGVKLWICSELEFLALRGLKDKLVPEWALKWFGHLRFTCLSCVHVLTQALWLVTWGLLTWVFKLFMFLLHLTFCQNIQSG